MPSSPLSVIRNVADQGLARWGALFLLSFLLHALLLAWMDGRMHWRDGKSTPPAQLAAIQASLSLSPEPPKPAEVPPPPPPPLPAAAAASSAPPSAPPTAPSTPRPVSPAPNPVVAPTSANAETGIHSDVINLGLLLPPDPIKPSETAVAPTTQASQVAPEMRLPRYPASPPPPIKLKYHIKQTKADGIQKHGSAQFSWQHEDGKYQLQGEFSLAFFTLASFESQGSFDANGVAPGLYTEKRMRRAPTNTHFNRPQADGAAHPTNADSISFSASSKVYPRPPGAQDRISVLWQMAGIGRALPHMFFKDAAFEIFVAGVRDADIWRLLVLGQEEVMYEGKKLALWHLQRLPRPGSYEQQLDLWLAPEMEWAPVRVLYTELNRDKLDLSLQGLQQTDDVSPPTNLRQAEP